MNSEPSDPTTLNAVTAVPTSTVRVASDAVVVPIPTLVDVLIPVELDSQRPEAPPPPPTPVKFDPSP